MIGKSESTEDATRHAVNGTKPAELSTRRSDARMRSRVMLKSSSSTLRALDSSESRSVVSRESSARYSAEKSASTDPDCSDLIETRAPSAWRAD